MMNWGYNMMGYGGFGWGPIIGIVLLVDLVLLGIWLWKQVNKK